MTFGSNYEIPNRHASELQDYRNVMLRAQSLGEIEDDSQSSFMRITEENGLNRRSTALEPQGGREPLCQNQKQSYIKALAYLFSDIKSQKLARRFMLGYIEEKRLIFHRILMQAKQKSLNGKKRGFDSGNICSVASEKPIKSPELISKHHRGTINDLGPIPSPKCVLPILSDMDNKLQQVFGSASLDIPHTTDNENKVFDVLSYCHDIYEEKLHAFRPCNILKTFKPFCTLEKAPTNGGSVQFYRCICQKDEKSGLLQQSLSTMQPLHHPTQSLMHHQLHGIHWLLSLYINGLNGVLADEMGLGKSIQTAVFLNIIRVIYNVRGHHLILCPTSMMQEWKKVFSTWCRTGEEEVEKRENYMHSGPHDGSPSESICSSGCRSSCHPTFRVHTISEVTDIVQKSWSNGIGSRSVARRGASTSWGANVRAILKKVDILIVNYDFLRQPLHAGSRDGANSPQNESLATYAVRRSLLRGSFHYVICDEGHRLWNMQSLTSKRVFMISSKYRLILTGTPLQNSLSELASLLKYIMAATCKIVSKANTHNPLSQHEKSGSDIETVLKSLFLDISQAQQITETSRRSDPNLLQPLTRRLHQLLRPFILRRERQTVFSGDLRKKEKAYEGHAPSESNGGIFASHIIVECPVSHLQQCALDRNPLAFHSMVNGNAARGANMPYSPLSAKSLFPKKISLHPYLLLREFPIDEKLIAASGKLATLDKIVHKVLSTENEISRFDSCLLNSSERAECNALEKIYERKILIFSHFHAMLDILEDWANLRHIKYLRIDGSTSAAVRGDVIERFTSDFTIPILFLSKRAGGLGLNLQAADTVILYEIGSNFSLDEQVISRIRRINQKKPIKVIQLLCGAGLEEGSREISEKRKQTSEMVLNEHQLNHFSTLQDRALSLCNAMQSGLARGPNEGESSQFLYVSPSDHAWNKALARSHAEEKLYAEIDKLLPQISAPSSPHASKHNEKERANGSHKRKGASQCPQDPGNTSRNYVEAAGEILNSSKKAKVVIRFKMK